MSLSLHKRRIIERLRRNGVKFIDPETVYIEGSAQIGAGTVVYPNVVLKAEVCIGENCVVGPNALIESSSIGDRTTINASQIYQSVIGSDSRVGPFSYIRPGTKVGDHVKIGDFVELKNSVIGDNASISHLTYVGDADIGKRVNLGCGVVTSNYNGREKSRTVVEDGAFIGCNTNLIPPVTVGAGAYTAAGSTITDNVPGGALGIARARQTNIENWVERSGLLKGR